MICIHESDCPYIKKYYTILEANGIPYEVVNCQDNGFWEKVKKASLFLHYLNMGPSELLLHHHLISIVDSVLKVPCFPDWSTAWHYDDKVAEIMLLQSKGFPIVDSWVFWDKAKALGWAKNTDYPVVFKLKNGAASINVVKVENYPHARKLINLMFGLGIVNNRVPGSNLFSVYKRDLKEYVKGNLIYFMDKSGIRPYVKGNWNRERGYAHFQRFIPNNDFDTRVHITFNTATASRRQNRPGDFRASGGKKIDFSPEKINLKMVETAFKITKEMGFQAMTYDFLMDENGNHLINEIGCQFADWAPYAFPGYWDSDLKWHEGHFWPQYIQLKHLLNKNDLIQPEFPEDNPDTKSFESF